MVSSVYINPAPVLLKVAATTIFTATKDTVLTLRVPNNDSSNRKLNLWKHTAVAASDVKRMIGKDTEIPPGSWLQMTIYLISGMILFATVDVDDKLTAIVEGIETTP